MLGRVAAAAGVPGPGLEKKTEKGVAPDDADGESPLASVSPATEKFEVGFEFLWGVRIPAALAPEPDFEGNICPAPVTGNPAAEEFAPEFGLDGDEFCAAAMAVSTAAVALGSGVSPGDTGVLVV
jgi:hypothetical protein